MVSSRKSRIVAVLAIGIGLLVACTTVPMEMTFRAPGDETLPVWPPAPARERIGYLGDLVGEENFARPADSREGAAVKVLRWIVGLTGGNEAPLTLQRPSSGMVDSRGRILVTDVSRQAVYVFDSGLGTLDTWTLAAPLEPFRAPVSITAAPEGGYFVSDAELAIIVRLDGDGNPLGRLEHSALDRPTGIVSDLVSGELYVADTRSHDIKVFDFSGTLLRTIGEPGTDRGQFNAPTHVALGRNLLCVTETLNARVQCFDRDGKSRLVVGRRGLRVGNLVRPKGVAIDGDNHIYVIESYYDHMLVFDDKGRFLLPIGGSGTRPGNFYLPAGVWVDQTRRIFVADMFNGRVSVFESLGFGSG